MAEPMVFDTVVARAVEMYGGLDSSEKEETEIAYHGVTIAALGERVTDNSTALELLSEVMKLSEIVYLPFVELQADKWREAICWLVHEHVEEGVRMSIAGASL